MYECASSWWSTWKPSLRTPSSVPVALADSSSVPCASQHGARGDQPAAHAAALCLRGGAVGGWGAGASVRRFRASAIVAQWPTGVVRGAGLQQCKLSVGSVERRDQGASGSVIRGTWQLEAGAESRAPLRAPSVVTAL